MSYRTHTIIIYGIQFALNFTRRDHNGNLVAYADLPLGKKWAKLCPATPQGIQEVCDFFDNGLRWHEAKVRSLGEDFITTL